jgi:hypothetical protein
MDTQAVAEQAVDTQTPPEMTPPVEEKTPNQNFLDKYQALVDELGLSFHYRIEHKMDSDGSFNGTNYQIIVFVAPK